MSKVMIIGCGGVASVAIAKCCQNSDVFTEIMIASRTKSKCDAMKEKLQPTTKTVITTAQVDADNTEELIALINEYKPDAVLNVALPYQDLTIMDACLATKTHYIDTANYEPEDTAKFEYKWQWAYREKFKEAGITALLGSGFDPGVTGVLTGIYMLLSGAIANYLAGVIADQTSQASFDASGAINYSINAYIEVFDQITWGALACVGLVLMIWLYQALKFRNRALALES